ESAAVGVREDSAAGLAGEPTGGGPGLAGVEDVEVPAPSSQGDDLAAQGLDEVDVVRFEVPEDEGLSPVAGDPGGHTPDDGARPQTGLAQDEGRGAGEQPGAAARGERVG